MEVSGQLHAPTTLPKGKKPQVSHWIGGWVGPRAGVDAVVRRKIQQFLKQFKIQYSCTRSLKWALSIIMSYNYTEQVPP
jgi:hypothetical protein